MDDLIATFLAVTGTEDDATAKQYLELTNNDLEYAVTLYMEAGHPSGGAGGSGGAAGGATGGGGGAGDFESDEAVAQRLQNEAYGEAQEVRAADTNIHRHETLLDSFGPPVMPRVPRESDMFGSGRVGIFNQRFDLDGNSQSYYDEDDDDDEDDEEEDHDYMDYGYSTINMNVHNVNGADDDDDDDDSDDSVMIIGSDGEVEEPQQRTTRSRVQSRRRGNRSNRMSELTSTQQRLANLFRPPFDIMSRIDIDSAKLEGRRSHKWLLVNIQDATEFTCQVLNRDFWSSSRVKTAVRENFVFLQYQNDSPNGYNYTNFYATDKFPHIAILDPMTGERVYRWTDGEVPSVDQWLADVEKFLEQFSLHPNSTNPIVRHEVKFDPDSLTEEQQIEFAMKQSVMENSGQSADDPISIDGGDGSATAAPAVETAPAAPRDPFLEIQPKDHDEPAANTTRVQVRFPNGKRLIHKFDVDVDTVGTLYQWLKHVISTDDSYDLAADDRFNISSASNKSGKALLDLLDVSISDAGLKNASILLEKE
ncbi:UBX domain-containing protein 5 [[Candida] anglica]